MVGGLAAASLASCTPPTRGGSGGTGSPCVSGQMQCGTTSCLNLQSDNQNCGTCGQVCGSGSTCTAGSCVCTGGFVSCGGTCVQSSPDHCGASCTACPSGDVCDSTGTCSSTCTSGTKCMDGTCSGPANAADCGTCGNACGSGSSCVSGICGCTVSGQQLCSGSCIDTTSNAGNCGSCGHACASGQTCTNGTCATVSTGTGGSAGTGGAGGAAGGVTGTGGLSRGPTPPMNGTNFPFPQNRQMSSCSYPTAYDNNDVMAAYTKWKTDLVTSSGAGNFQRVQRTSSDGLGSPSGATPLNSTVSEGIGYGMVIAVYMGDHTLFDNLWKYEQLHTDS
ncbi:MAG TPA: glycosyl hydrolase family 8, partial [Polyangia bacterium]|nr:glycosyl hydrolase family 8 [Polyangia bacterium]